MSDHMYFAHSGVKGMHWGVRRYQNEDGTYTEEGKARRHSDGQQTSEKKSGMSDRTKKALKIGAAVAGAALVAYGGYKLYSNSESGKTNKIMAAHAKELSKNFREAIANNDGNALKQLKDQVDTEKNLRNGISEMKKSTASGFISSAAKDAGKKAVATAMAGAGIYGVSAFVDGKFDRSKLASSIFNGGPKKK